MPNELPPMDFFPPHHRRGLFYSDAWRQAWLKAYGDHPKIELHPAAGIYTYRQKLKGLIPIRSATLIGATSPATRSIRAEYTCVTDEALSASLNAPWDQLVLPDILSGSEDEQRIHQFAREHNLTVRQPKVELAYAVDLRQGTFDDYLNSLGKNTRLQLFNRRKRLAQHGEIRVENLWPDRDRFYQLLNEFHSVRWGKPCYTGRNLAFIEALLTGLDNEGTKIDLSVLSISNKPISVALDITTKGRCYNLQSGYIENFEKGLSLGTLQLGHQIERAYESKTDFYDFMAGSGKNAQYKQALSTIDTNVVSLELARNAVLKKLYTVRDRVTSSRIFLHDCL